jgi:hypothetical protein
MSEFEVKVNAELLRLQNQARELENERLQIQTEKEIKLAEMAHEKEIKIKLAEMAHEEEMAKIKIEELKLRDSKRSSHLASSGPDGNRVYSAASANDGLKNIVTNILSSNISLSFGNKPFSKVELVTHQALMQAIDLCAVDDASPQVIIRINSALLFSHLSRLLNRATIHTKLT